MSLCTMPRPCKYATPSIRSSSIFAACSSEVLCQKYDVASRWMARTVASVIVPPVGPYTNFLERLSYVITWPIAMCSRMSRMGSSSESLIICTRCHNKGGYSEERRVYLEETHHVAVVQMTHNLHFHEHLIDRAVSVFVVDVFRLDRKSVV